VNQAFNPGFQLHESAEIGNPRTLPRMREPTSYFLAPLRSTDRATVASAQRDLPRVAIDFQDFDFNLLILGHDVGRLHSARISHVGDVKQSVHAAQIDECAEVGNRADSAPEPRRLPVASESFLLGFAFALF